MNKKNAQTNLAGLQCPQRRKYIIKDTDLYLSHELIRQGSVIELDDKDANALRDYLVPLDNESE